MDWLKRLSGFHGRSISADLAVIGSVYVIGERVLLEVRRRDKAGNDYVAECAICTLDRDDDELGKAVIASLRQSAHIGPDPGDIDALWNEFLRCTGHTSWAGLHNKARHFCFYGTLGDYLEITASRKERGSFIHLDKSLRVPWTGAEIGRALRSIINENAG